MNSMPLLLRLAHTLAPWGLAATALGAAGADFAQTPLVHRCDVGDRVVFQQAACPPGQAGRVVPVAPGNVVSAPARAAASAAVAAAASGPATATTSAPAPAPAPTAAQPPSDDQACLAYLKPLLRDPSSARILTSTREGRVLRVQLQAGDARGRLHTRDAACEFVNGRVDDGWSRIQLERLGWFAPRAWVLGSSPESRRAARALEESIEALP